MEHLVSTLRKSVVQYKMAPRGKKIRHRALSARLHKLRKTRNESALPNSGRSRWNTQILPSFSVTWSRLQQKVSQKRSHSDPYSFKKFVVFLFEIVDTAQSTNFNYTILWLLVPSFSSQKRYSRSICCVVNVIKTMLLMAIIVNIITWQGAP